MSTNMEAITFKIDGVEVQGMPGQTILEAADEAGVYIPRLCQMKGITPHGSCRVCTVKIGKNWFAAACTQPISDGMEIDNSSDEVMQLRKDLVEMLFTEGNHYCMFCDKSGNCELQAMAYRLGILAPKYPYIYPDRALDASHPDVFIDKNRCILCARCVNSAKELDGKTVFDFAGRGPHKEVIVNGEKLSDTQLKGVDKAAEACPVGAILPKKGAYAKPVGQRDYDKAPIGSDIEAKVCK